MKIINHYFKKQLIAVFITLLLVLTSLAWMLQIMGMMKLLLNYGVDIKSFVGLIALMIPFIMSIIIPFVSFIAVIFVYNKLIADNEVTVLAASGMSPAQIARPALSLAMILTFFHLVLNIWIVPMTQARFYDTQWELRYGLAHLKLQESAFTKISPALVVYVDKVAGHDLSQVMLSDIRNPKSKLTVFAEKGKLISTNRGLSIVMANGSLQSRDENLTSGTFDTFDMDLNITDKANESIFKVRRIPTIQLLKSVAESDSPRNHKLVLSEIASRILNPFMNLILVALCCLILLRASLLRRRASFAPVLSVMAMAVIMALWMTGSNMMSHLKDLLVLTVLQISLFGFILYKLIKK